MNLAQYKKEEKKMDFSEEVFRSASMSCSAVKSIRDKQLKALTKISDIGFPNKNNEDWKYFDFSEILSENFSLDPQILSEKEINEYKELISRYVFPETLNNTIVTINGAYSRELSNFNFNLKKIRIHNFNNPGELDGDDLALKVVEKFFAQDIDSEENYFKAINTSLMRNGFLLLLEDNFYMDNPIHILHLSNKNTFNQTRSLIYLGKNSRLKLFVSYLGIDEAKYFTNSSVEAFLMPNSSLKLHKIQNESQNAISFYDFKATLEKDSRFNFNSYDFGAKTARNEVDVNLNDAGSSAEVNGLYVLNKERKSHHNIKIHHNHSHTTSQQLFKGLLYDKSRAEFNGLIRVSKDAQLVDAKQLNKNLLLSDSAHVDSRPQLEILADDVKCAHGSTIGQLDEDEIFYMQSRGIDFKTATQMITYSFCEEIIRNIGMESANNYVSKLAVKELNSIPSRSRSTKKQCLS